MTDRDLLDQIRHLKPWHQNIRITETVDVISAFDESERQRLNNQNISLIDARHGFMEKIQLIYPQGLAGKRFLDCACNAGGYCFWAKEMGAEAAYGFDVRDHWIRQAEFVRKNRSIGNQENLQFEVCDLMELPHRKKNLAPADLTLFKGIFYHLADPILGLKIAAELTSEVMWFNSARCFQENPDSLVCTFESQSNLMSGVHSLSWIPSGPKVIAKLLYWLGFQDIRHVYSKQYEQKPGYGRMEIMAARRPGMLDAFSESQQATKIETGDFTNATIASDDLKALF